MVSYNDAATTAAAAAAAAADDDDVYDNDDDDSMKYTGLLSKERVNYKHVSQNK